MIVVPVFCCECIEEFVETIDYTIYTKAIYSVYISRLLYIWLTSYEVVPFLRGSGAVGCQLPLQ